MDTEILSFTPIRSLQEYPMSVEEDKSPASRGRQNSKVKVLVRSHAIREEASPPRDSSPSIAIKVISSSQSSPVLVLSPSPSPASPTSTLVPSPTRGSPHGEAEEGGSPRYLNRLNRQNLEKDASHRNKKIICDCTTQNCSKCRSQERNFNNNVTSVNNNVVQDRLKVSSRSKLRQQSSSQGSFDGSSSNSPCLSRDSSSEQYTDTSGADLEVFIPETLNRNSKDRAFMLRIEQELVNLAKDKSKTHYKFPPMSSYQRMLVHRCAAYFGMDHNIESSGKCVVVNKTKNTRIPEVEFKEHIKEDVVFSEEPRRSILKRDSNSVEEYGFKSPDRQYLMESRRSKSFEEREEEYAKVRRRIFNREELLRHMQDEDFEWAEVPWSSTDSDGSRFRLQLPENVRRGARLNKVLSEEVGETSRPYVAKSYSFGGYAGVLNRGDSVLSTHSAGARLLTKQDSGASSVSWRLSPSSSGYKSQSQMSESITPSPTSTPNQLDPAHHDLSSDKSDRIVWAVTDIQRVPKGSIIIDPSTGEPVKNEDGSIYHYDPNHPPPGFSKPPPSPKKSPQHQHTSPKKKMSPVHKSRLTNSATSPSLPYSPPRFPMGGGEAMLPPLQVYGGGYGPPPPPEVPFYQQCVVYAPYGGGIVSPHFNQQEPPISDVPFYVSDPAPPPQALPYQQPPYWNQQPVTFYQNAPPPNPAPPQRFPLHPPNQNFVSSFAPNYLPPPTQAPPPAPNPEIIPMFPQQPVQLLYSNQSNPQVLYPSNQSNVVYAQNPVYYPPYPQSTSTPNGCTPQFSSQEQNVIQLAQNMSQLSFVQNQNYAKMTTPPHFDAVSRQKTCTPKNSNKFGSTAKNFVLGSSQSSTGTNSPAATVIAGYCPQNPGMYRTPSETPPNQMNYGPGFAAGPPGPVFLRQMSNVRSNTPGTARSSRSPTPASDIPHFDRPRLPPPVAYHGMPYVLPPDNRIIPGRSQPNPYRHPVPFRQQSFNQQDRGQRNNRKTKGNKPTGLPPPATK